MRDATEVGGGCADIGVPQGIGGVWLGKKRLSGGGWHGRGCGFGGCCGYGAVQGTGLPCRDSLKVRNRGIVWAWRQRRAISRGSAIVVSQTALKRIREKIWAGTFSNHSNSGGSKANSFRPNPIRKFSNRGDSGDSKAIRPEKRLRAGTMHIKEPQKTPGLPASGSGCRAISAARSPQA